MLASLVLAIFVAALAIFVNGAVLRRERETYAAAAASSVDASLTLMDETLYTVGTYFSHLVPLVGIYSGASEGVEAVEAVYDVTLATVNYNDMIADVIVVAPDGRARSYANGEGMYLVELVSAQYDYADADLVATRYFFFPDFASPHDEAFAYVVPLLDVDTATGQVTKLASIIVACYARGIRSLVEQGLNAEYAYQLTASDGSVVARNEPDGFAKGGASHTLSLKYPYRSVEIRAPRVWPLGGGSWHEITAGVCAAVVAVTLFSVIVIRASILRPVYAVSREIARIGAPGGVGRLCYGGVREIDLIAKSVNEMLDRMAELTRAELDARTGLIEARLRKNEAELYALQSQINPHFLFNSLQCIRAMAILASAGDVASMTSSLSSLLRYAISGAGMVRVREEIGAVKEYLNIVDIRYDHRFRLELDVAEDAMDVPIPKMILQPVVENAVSHGVSMREDGGRVSIAARARDGKLVFTVTDDGPGIPPARLEAMRTALTVDFHDALNARKLTSFGLYNIQRRIRLRFGEEYGLTLESEAEETRTIIVIPTGENES
jgi:hypothetical protein